MHFVMGTETFYQSPDKVNSRWKDIIFSNFSDVEDESNVAGDCGSSKAPGVQHQAGVQP